MLKSDHSTPQSIKVQTPRGTLTLVSRQQITGHQLVRALANAFDFQSVLKETGYNGALYNWKDEMVHLKETVPPGEYRYDVFV